MRFDRFRAVRGPVAPRSLRGLRVAAAFAAPDNAFRPGPRAARMDVPEAADACDRVVSEVGGAVVADREFLDRVTLGILARGHVLLEDVPGRRARSRPRSA